MTSSISLKAIYFVSFFITHFLGSIIGSLIKSKKYSFLIDFFSGCFLLSFSLNHIYHVTASDTFFQSYPFQSLIAIIIFSLLTLFYFLKDSTSPIDETMLVKYDTTGSSIRENNQYTLNSTDIHQIFQNELDVRNDTKQNDESTLTYKQKFRFCDHLPLIIYYIVSLESAISFGLYLSTYTKNQLNHNCPYFLAFRFIESVILSIILSKIPISRIVFWVMIIFYSIFSFFILISISAPKNISTINHAYKISYSFILGIYFYFGSLLLHNGFANLSGSFIFSFFIMIISFMLPYLLTIGIDYKI